MAIESEWGSGTYGAESNAAPAKNAKPFKKLDPKSVTPEQHAQHVANIEASVNSATPEERRGGKGWYKSAHRQAARVGAGIDPSASRNEQRKHWNEYYNSTSPGQRGENTTRAAAAIARLSPSSGGMNWERNVPAAYEVSQMSDEDADKVRSGKRSPVAGKNLRFASSQDIVKAHQLAHGDKKPEEVLPMHLKTGSFFQNINKPMQSGPVTVDARSHDITTGTRNKWGTDLGLGAKGRYDYFQGAHQEAARNLGMRPHQVQAISWVADKRRAVEQGVGITTDAKGNRVAGQGKMSKGGRQGTQAG
jgi:hypothetical protein